MPENDERKPAESDERHPIPVLLAVFDILGFKDFVKGNSLLTVRQTYDSLIERTVARQSGWSFEVLWKDEVGVPAIFTLSVQSVIFSDSVIAWVPLRQGFTSSFFKWCSDFICEALALDIPVRAAVAAGEAIMHKDTQTFIGQPIIDAHLLEEAQNWIGIAIAPSATWPPLIADASPKLLMEYKVPIKPGCESLASPIALDWPRFWREYHAACPSTKLSELRARNAHKPLYYDNAIGFANHSRDHSNWFNETQPENAQLRMRPFNEVKQEYERMQSKDG